MNACQDVNTCQVGAYEVEKSFEKKAVYRNRSYSFTLFDDGNNEDFQDETDEVYLATIMVVWLDLVFSTYRKDNSI